MSEVCEAFGVARKTGYKWLARYQTHGAIGLEELSRAPHDTECDRSPGGRSDHGAHAESAPLGAQEAVWHTCSEVAGDRFPSESTTSEKSSTAGPVVARTKANRTAVYSRHSSDTTAEWLCGGIDFKGCSAPETASSAIRSRSQMASADTCSGAMGASASTSRSCVSLLLSALRSMDFRTPFAATTGRRSRRVHRGVSSLQSAHQARRPARAHSARKTHAERPP